MNPNWESVIIEAIRAKEVVVVTYRHVQDGLVTIREMEPFDISRGRRSPSSRRSFWGWCLFHRRMERKHLSGILRVERTGRAFDPSVRERTFRSRPRYVVSREW